MLPQDPDTETFEHFLDLPRELRDQIYRELLIPDKTRIFRPAKGSKSPLSSCYSLRPAILRVNKQIHGEASKILYKENNWILLTTNQPGDRGLLQDFRQSFKPWVSVRHLEYFPGKPVLRIKVVDRLSRSQRSKEMMLLTEQDVHDFCLEIPLLRHFEIYLYFDADAMLNPYLRDVLVDCCRDIRGAEKVTIIRPQCPFPYKELVAQLLTPMRRLEDFLDRGVTYKQRGDLQADLGRLLSAAHIYLTGYCLLQFRYRSPWIAQSETGDLNPETIMQVRKYETMFSTKCADCLRKVGLPRGAQVVLRKALNDAKTVSYTPDRDYGSMLYHLGLAIVAEGDDIRALRYFCMALIMDPSQRGADAQGGAILDKTQTVLRDKRVEVERYIEDVMNRIRLRTSGKKWTIFTAERLAGQRI